MSERGEVVGPTSEAILYVMETWPGTWTVRELGEHFNAHSSRWPTIANRLKALEAAGRVVADRTTNTDGTRRGTATVPVEWRAVFPRCSPEEATDDGPPLVHVHYHGWVSHGFAAMAGLIEENQEKG